MRSFWFVLSISGLLITLVLVDFSAVSSRAMAQIFGIATDNRLLSVIDLKNPKQSANTREEQSAPGKITPINRDVSITEIVFDPEGSDIGKEFIKLHNYSASDIDLNGWSLRLARAGKDDSTSLAKIGSAPADKIIIKTGGFFVVGLNKYSITPEADVIRGAALPNAGGIVLLIDSSGETVVSVKYGDANQ